MCRTKGVICLSRFGCAGYVPDNLTQVVAFPKLKRMEFCNSVLWKLTRDRNSSLGTSILNDHSIIETGTIGIFAMVILEILFCNIFLWNY